MTADERKYKSNDSSILQEFLTEARLWKWSDSTNAAMWMDSKVEGGGLCRRGFNYLLLFTGDMTSLDDYIKGR